MILNKVEIIGKPYNKAVKETKTGKTVTEFGLSVYAGKKQDGKPMYKFITCKIWEALQDIDNKNVLVKGKIAFDVWQKDGKELSKPYILCSSVELAKETEETKDDEIPF